MSSTNSSLKDSAQGSAQQEMMMARPEVDQDHMQVQPSQVAPAVQAEIEKKEGDHFEVASQISQTVIDQTARDELSTKEKMEEGEKIFLRRKAMLDESF